jgi:phosphonate transport system substrate-binding protein
VGDHDATPNPDDTPRELGVGVALTTDPSTTRVLLDEFAFALSDATGLRVVGAGVWHYQHLIQELGAGHMHLLALRATVEDKVVPLALPVRDGVSTYRAVLYSAPGSPIQTVHDLNGLRAAWVDRQSATGYLIIRAHMEARGVLLKDAFSAEQFFGTHQAVADAVLDGEADVGASYLYLDEDGLEAPSHRSGWGDREVHIVAQSGPIPSDIVAADKRVPRSMQQAVQAALVDGEHPALRRAAKALLCADGFVAPTAEILRPLQELLGGLKGATGGHSLFPPPPPPPSKRAG